MSTTLRPITDISIESTLESGSNAYALIDESVLDTADYLYVTANSNTIPLVFTDEFEFTELTSDDAVSSVIMSGYFGSLFLTYGYFKIRFFLKIAGTEYYSGYFNVQATSVAYSYEWEVNPSDDSAWDKTTINGMTGGIEYSILGSYDTETGTGK